MNNQVFEKFCRTKNFTVRILFKIFFYTRAFSSRKMCYVSDKRFTSIYIYIYVLKWRRERNERFHTGYLKWKCPWLVLDFKLFSPSLSTRSSCFCHAKSLLSLPSSFIFLSLSFYPRQTYCHSHTFHLPQDDPIGELRRSIKIYV